MEKINNVEDLMGLIELAENASDKIDKLKNKRFLNSFGIILILIFFTIGVLYSYAAYQANGLVPIDLMLIIGFLLIIFISFSNFYKIQNAIKVELRVLNKLYNLIDPLKSLAKKDISIMKMATIEMRLSRIDFGNYQSKEKPNRAEKQLNLEKLKERLSLDS